MRISGCAAVHLLFLAILGMSVSGVEVFAEDRVFYAGVAVPAGSFQASLDKTVDNRAPDTLVPEPRRGMVFRDKASADGAAYGAGLLAGFRVKVAESGLYLGGEVDVDWRGGDADGKFDGIGTSAGRNQLGEHWPDRWAYQGNRSYGVALKLSGSPAGLRTFDASLHVLGGFRWLDGEFTNRFHGCLSPTPCSSAPDTPAFVSGTEKRDMDLKGWMVGLGVEKRVRPQLALRAEGRYTNYKAKRWITRFDDVGVTVPAVLDADELGVSVSLAWYL